MRKCNKLVRDRIPDIIEADGKTCITEVLDQVTYLQMLDEKLTEELTEYQESNSMEELADLLEEDFFIKLFSETFGAEKAGHLYPQYHFYDIYQNSRYADFVLENGAHRVAIEIDDETSHNKSLVASNKFYDDLLKQNRIFAKGSYMDQEAARNILANHFKRFKDMQMLCYTKTLGIVRVEEAVWKKLSHEGKVEIERICDEKLAEYYARW